MEQQENSEETAFFYSSRVGSEKTQPRSNGTTCPIKREAFQ
jgi:hypothetical protein